MAPPEEQRQELKRKRVVDRSIDDEDLKRKKKARKEEKRRAKQANNENSDAAPKASLAKPQIPPRDHRSRSRTPTRSPEHRRRRSSQTTGLSKSDRKRLRQEARSKSQASKTRRRSSQDGAAVNGEASRQSNVNGEPSHLSKKKAKQQRKQSGKALIDKDSNGLDSNPAVPHSAKKKRRTAKKQAKAASAVSEASSVMARTWRLSDPFGGRYADSQPNFSPDESHILLATEHQLGSFSTDNSLLDQCLPSGSSGDITSYTLSQIDSANVYIGTQTGYVVSWNRATGTRLGRWMTGTPIWGVACAQMEGATLDTVFTIDQSGLQWNITAHRFGIDGDPSKTELATMLKYSKSIRSLRVTRGCKALVAMTPDSLLIGKLASGGEKALKKVEYIWREVPCREPPTCIDVQASRRSRDSFDLDAEDIDVVYGGLKGSLFHYQTVFSKLTMTDRPKKHVISTRALDAPRLHWHREAVGAVAFSRDGSYIISGGSETVLVLWQLDTGRKQFLPHLESPIVALAVSPSGAFYAVGLGDNSIMVLSTAELKPTANFAGLQTPCTSLFPPHQMMLPTNELFEQMATGRAASSVAATVNPQQLDSLLCAVPTSQSIRAEVFPANPSSPYLQTYSLSGPSTSRHISRQALTRTNATIANLGPEGNKLVEPSIIHVAMSQNGQWLATVDEWTPPRQDLEDLVIQAADFDVESPHQRQVTLRFWKWNESENPAEGPGTWQLNSRIDAPHMLDGTRVAGRVLALDSCPSSSGFATVGEDNTVRLWSPKTRAPNGQLYWRETAPQSAEQQASKRAQAKTQTWWAARHRIPLDLPAPDETLTRLYPDRAALAYSNDGSLVAIHVHHKTVSNALVPAQAASAAQAPDYDDPTNTLIHFVDADFGTIRELRSDLCPTIPSALAESSRRGAPADGIHALAFLDAALIVLTRHAAYVWAVTSFTLLATIPLPSLVPDNSAAQPYTTPAALPAPFLATNPPTHTFAISAPIPASAPERALSARYNLPPHPHRDLRSSIAVYTLPPRAATEPPEPVFAAPAQRLTLALLNAAGSAAPADAPRTASLHGEGAALARRAAGSGFHVLDCGATLRSVRPPLAAPGVGRAGAHREGKRADKDADEDADGAAEGALGRLSRREGGVALRGEAGNDDGAADDDEDDDDDDDDEAAPHRARDAPVVSAERLAAVFEPAGPAGRMPSVRDMFDGVLALFAGKPDVRHE